MKKIAVIGGGISGVSVARMLQSQFDVTIFEKNSSLGGLIRCERVNDNLFHKVGGHVFNTKNQKVADWFWSFFNKNTEFIKTKRNAKILLNGKIVGYPIENYLHQLEPKITQQIIKELLHKNVGVPTNFQDFLKGNFGATLYNIYFKPYNEKIWNIDLRQVPLEWLDGKLPMPNVENIILTNIYHQEEEEMVHSYFYYAKEGGSQFIIDKIGSGIRASLGEEVKTIKKEEGCYQINGSGKFDYVIYCGDIRSFGHVLLSEDASVNEALTSVRNLRSNGTSNYFCETDDTDISWLYLPDESLKAHRIIYTGNFSDSNNRGSLRKTCVVEFSGQHERGDMEKELSRLPGNLKPLAYNYEANSYIIHDKDTRSRIARLKSLLKTNGIFLLGRFAEWEYYNMDKCMESAMAISEQLINEHRS